MNFQSILNCIKLKYDLQIEENEEDECLCHSLEKYLQSIECESDCNPFSEVEDEKPGLVRGGIFGNLASDGDTCVSALKIFLISHQDETVKSFTVKEGKRNVKLRQGRIIKVVQNVGNCCWHLYERKYHKGTPFYLSNSGVAQELHFTLKSWKPTQCK